MSEGQGDEGVKRMLSKNVRESRSIFTGQILGGLHSVGEGGGGGRGHRATNNKSLDKAPPVVNQSADREISFKKTCFIFFYFKIHETGHLEG